MKLIVCDSYEEVSRKAAEIVAEQVRTAPDCVLGLATGSTPIGMYSMLADMNKKGEIDFSRVRSFNLDEYYPISDDNPQSYHYFMNENLFSKINIDKKNTHILNGMCEDTAEECVRFEKEITDNGGIDLQILGIGQNGHIGFNEPAPNLNSFTHLTDLTENTIAANSRFFDKIEDVPTRALTMGIGTILKARKIILLASGRSKYNAVKELLNNAITTDSPASMLKVHPNVILICDREAYSDNRIGIDIGGTEIKFGILDENNKLIYKDSIPTPTESEDAILGSICAKCKEIMKEYCIAAIGVGTPGTIRGGLVTAANIPFSKTDIGGRIGTETGLPVRVCNDANCAALGEALCGGGMDADNVIMISIGTGIGGGIVIGKKLYEGKGCAGEIGHLRIETDGRECPCGQKGCWEQYASAKALVHAAEIAAQNEDTSTLYRLYAENGNKLTGKLFFKALTEGCSAAEGVFEEYLKYLASGIQSLIEIFDPDAVILSGGITNVGDTLLTPLKALVNKDVPIFVSTLKSEAGIYGAAMLK